jgi:hypothetical protein
LKKNQTNSLFILKFGKHKEMGCDFELQIQVFIGGKWVPVVFFGTKTGCGGFPLGNATRTLYKKKLFKGDYRRNDPVSFEYKKSLLQMGLCETEKAEEGGPKEIKNDVLEDIVNENQKEKIQEEKAAEEDYEALSEDEEEAEYYARKYRSFLFYSIEQFQELILCIEPLPNCEVNYSRLYIDTMKPVPKWMEMAKSIWPMETEIWMGSDAEEIESTTEELTDAFKRLSAYWKTTLHGLDCWTRLPYELVEIIAEYSVPYASDVRLAWWSEEGHTERLIADK